MARLTRKNIKVFAGSATNTGVFGSLQANNPTTSTDVEQIQSLSAWEEGWNAATETSEELPPLEEFQGVQYVTTYQQAYLMQEGLPEWAATVTYYKGSLIKEVTVNGFRIYCSLIDDNIGNIISDTSSWKKVMDSEDLYAFDSTVVHKADTETISGEKTFSVSPMVPTATSGDSSTKAANTEFVTTVSSNLQTQINQKANSSDVVNLTGTQTISGQKTFSSVAYGVASDANGSVLTTVNKSKAANGCFKLGNGLIIQWGIITVSTSNRYSAVITFPIPFSNTNYSLNITQYTTTNAMIWSTPAVLMFGNKTTTSVKTQSQHTDRLQWIAVGY